MNKKPYEKFGFAITFYPSKNSNIVCWCPDKEKAEAIIEVLQKRYCNTKFSIVESKELNKQTISKNAEVVKRSSRSQPIFYKLEA